MDSTSPSLLIRVKDRNDHQAWQEFFELYSPLLYHYAIERGLGHDDAEDVRASCYETIVKKISEFSYDSENTGFRAWLRTMVNRRVIDFARKRKLPVAESRDLRNLEDSHPSTDVLWDQNWRLHHLRYCVSIVSKKVAATSFEAFRLLTEEEMPVTEVCEHLEMSREQVYKIKSRFLELVRQEMKKFDLDA